MADENINYEAVLADLRAKRERLDAAISGIEAMLGLGGLEAPSEATASLGTQVNEDSFLGMSMPAAVEKYLRIVKKPQTTPQIAAGLKSGGIVSEADNFTNAVYTALKRRDPEIVRVGKKWMLKEWRPGARSTTAKKKTNGADDDGDEGNGEAVEGLGF